MKISGKFCDIFKYEDRYQEHTGDDREYYECILLKDFGVYKKGDKIERISVDKDDCSLYIYDKEQMYVFYPTWNPCV